MKRYKCLEIEKVYARNYIWKLIMVLLSPQILDGHVAALSVVCIVLCLSTILLVCLPWLATVRRCGGALALFVWGTLYVTAIVFIFTGGPVTTWEQVRS